MKTKIKFIDENISSKDLENNINYICSKFGVGKTTLLVKIAANFSYQDNKKILFISDSDNTKVLENKFLSGLTHISINDVGTIKLGKDLLGENTTINIKTRIQENEINDILNKSLDFDLIILDGFEDYNVNKFKVNFKGALFVSRNVNQTTQNSVNGNYIFINKTLTDKENDTAKINIVTNDIIINNLKVVFNNTNLDIRCL